MQADRMYTLKHLYLIILIPALVVPGCSATDIRRAGEIIHADDPARQASRVLESKARQLAANPQQIPRELQALKARIDLFRQVVESIWGKEDAQEAGPKDYVKYTDEYYNRAHIDFEAGTVTIETVAPDSQRQYLKKAIVTTLLTPADPREVDLYSAAAPGAGGGQRPFLYEQVLDHDGQPIAWEWRAGRYADHLLHTRVTRVNIGNREGLRVVFPLVARHEQLRAYKYASLVQKYSRQYDIPESLIYGVMKTESSFNPFAVSSAPAYGLMQIVPETAGRDVFQLIKRRSDQPTPEYLFDPENNIDTGTAYLHILHERYLARIRDDNSKRYSVISAYNGGAGNVLRTFAGNRDQAFSRINRLTPDQVFEQLTGNHPSAESRRYLHKVIQAQQEFWQNN